MLFQYSCLPMEKSFENDLLVYLFIAGRRAEFAENLAAEYQTTSSHVWSFQGKFQLQHKLLS